jgi:hypothetical protein
VPEGAFSEPGEHSLLPGVDGRRWPREVSIFAGGAARKTPSLPSASGIHPAPLESGSMLESEPVGDRPIAEGVQGLQDGEFEATASLEAMGDRSPTIWPSSSN